MTDEKETVLHRFEPDENKNLRFVQTACSKDPGRPILTGICIDETNAIAADGFRMHIVPRPESIVKEYPLAFPSVVRPVAPSGRTRKIPGNPEYLELETIEGTFPQWEAIVPKDEPFFRYAVNKQYLKDVAEMPGSDMIIFEFFSPMAPCRIFTFQEEDSDRYGWNDSGTPSGNQAVIMPMYLPDDIRLHPEKDLKELAMIRKANALRRTPDVEE